MQIRKLEHNTRYRIFNRCNGHNGTFMTWKKVKFSVNVAFSQSLKFDLGENKGTEG